MVRRRRLFVDIEEYLQRPRAERLAHIDLAEPCILIGGRGDYFRGLLCHYLFTTMPLRKAIHLCHLCHKNECSNPRHMYWGTVQENNQDARDAGHITSLWARVVAKYGLEKAREMVRKNASLGGKAFQANARKKRKAYRA